MAAIILLAGAAACVFTVFNIFFTYPIKDSTARKIELFGYFLLVIVLIWEFFVKNLVLKAFYEEADFFYLNEKLQIIYDMLNDIQQGRYTDADVSIYFDSLHHSEYLLSQLLAFDIIEAVLKISSTILIAVGRLQELIPKSQKKSRMRKSFEIRRARSLKKKQKL